MGGVTAVFEMPNTNPATIDAAALEEKLTRAEGRAWCAHAFFIGAAAENADNLGELERLPGCCGVTISMGSSTGSLLVNEDEVLRRLLCSAPRPAHLPSETSARLCDRLAPIRARLTFHAHPAYTT